MAATIFCLQHVQTSIDHILRLLGLLVPLYSNLGYLSLISKSRPGVKSVFQSEPLQRYCGGFVFKQDLSANMTNENRDVIIGTTYKCFSST